MAKFNQKEWRHVRGTSDKPGGVIYQGAKPFTLNGKKVTPGQEVSRRQYENLRYTQSGWQNKSQYEAIQKERPPRGKAREAGLFQLWRRIYSEENDIPIGDIKGPDNPYAQAFASAYKNNFKDTGPNSPFAELLTVVGLRDKGQPWDVGDSPGK